MLEFQALPTWFGLAVLLVAVFRLVGRELGVRRELCGSITTRRVEYGHSPDDDDNWMVPLAENANTWWYGFVIRKRRPGRFWWLSKAILLFLTGRKRQQ